jgi:hypothetical protein
MSERLVRNWWVISALFASLRRGKTIRELLVSDQLASNEERRREAVSRQFLSCNRAIVIPTIEVGNKESVNDCVAESVTPNKYRQHGTII